jgi:hypothetical protein
LKLSSPYPVQFPDVAVLGVLRVLQYLASQAFGSFAVSGGMAKKIVDVR